MRLSSDKNKVMGMNSLNERKSVWRLGENEVQQTDECKYRDVVESFYFCFFFLEGGEKVK